MRWIRGTTLILAVVMLFASPLDAGEPWGSPGSCTETDTHGEHTGTFEFSPGGGATCAYIPDPGQGQAGTHFKYVTLD